MRLDSLLSRLAASGVRATQPFTDVGLNALVTGASLDSRTVGPGDIYVARHGVENDGHRFILSAVQRGAVAVIGADELSPEVASTLVDRTVPYLRVRNPAEALGYAASILAGEPSKKLIIVGVTGTNGKTTVATMLRDIYSVLGYKVGMIGTTGIWVDGKRIPNTHTTPDAVALHRHFAEMVAVGCTHCFMEVTSHAIDQDRTAGIHFRGGIFTNLSPEHLDYHKSIEAYALTKKRFFDSLSGSSFGVFNGEDAFSDLMMKEFAGRVFRFGELESGPVGLSVLASGDEGWVLEVNGQEILTPLLGDHNVSNLRAALTAAAAMGVGDDDIIRAVTAVDAPPGRMTVVSRSPILAIVDFAHTPDALVKVMQTVRLLRPSGRLIVVGGCGGNRDQQKRPVMGEILSGADIAIFTSDNPRREDPVDIIDQMVSGVPMQLRGRLEVVVDRREAIRSAVRSAQSGDVVVVAGKGHETTQEIGAATLPFDDVEELSAALSGRVS